MRDVEMKEPCDQARAGRRGFLKLAAVGGVGGAAVAMASGENVEAAEVVSETAAGYRESEHVRKVYDLARF